jgi:uroporphyrinogen-III synthase
VITSPNGAERVTRLLTHEASTARIAAVGAATAATLPHCDLVADTQSASGLLEIFPPGPGHVVVVQAVDAAPTLVDGLRASAWNVTSITPYRTVPTTPSAEQRRAALAADAVLFASGSAVLAWVAVFGNSAPPVAVAIGDQTAAAAERAGLKISAISADHSMNGMLITLNRYFSDRT